MCLCVCLCVLLLLHSFNHQNTIFKHFHLYTRTHTHTNSDNTLTYCFGKVQKLEKLFIMRVYVNQKCVCMLVCVIIHNVLCYKITINSKSMYVYTKYSMVMKAQHHIYNICWDETWANKESNINIIKIPW